jgi:hypothetical protein
MQQLEIKPSHKPIKQYYAALAEFEKHGATKETSVRAAFQEILTTYAGKKKWSFIAEEGISCVSSRNCRRAKIEVVEKIRQRTALQRGYAAAILYHFDEHRACVLPANQTARTLRWNLRFDKYFAKSSYISEESDGHHQR